jgi:hypothetical protein
MSGDLELVKKYEPVLRFSKDKKGDDESFYPMAASDYVHACGLRREKVGWIHDPGRALLKHLSTVLQPDACYLSYAAGDLEDDGVVLALVDRGLELARVHGPAAMPASGGEASHAIASGQDAAMEAGAAPVGADEVLMPRLLVSSEEAEALLERLGDTGGAERQPLDAGDYATLSGAPLAGAQVDSDGEAALLAGAAAFDPGAGELAAPMEWLQLASLASLSESIQRRALEKYEPYRDWGRHPPIYYYYVSRDGAFTVLHYWLLYAFNDWGGHGGKNDHEGDWEVVFVVLDDRAEPQHLICSRHVKVPLLFEPLTAPWGEVERVDGSHPVVYVGCGSHASYLEADRHSVVGYQDYALGNGLAIGPMGDQPWGRPVYLGRKRWNQRFSGRWGSLVKRWSLIVMPGTLGPTGPGQKGTKWSNPAKWAGLI